ncbi:MAG: class I SAM-dependent methyltransferase [Rubrobacter sp.]|nr:class I SAM-dependent methyltransferase [Rubrobacter sp.]
MNEDHHQTLYETNEFYWGKEPNDFARRALDFIPEGEPLRVIDIGAGEGRDSVFFAERGFDVLAVDAAPNGLEKATRLAKERGVEVEVREGDVNSLEPEGSFALVYSAGTIQYLRPENREKQFAHFRERTAPGGFHALLTFVEDPEIPPAPDWSENEFLYAPGELREYYAGWECLHSRAFVFDDDSGGEPHKHAVEEYVFLKP